MATTITKEAKQAAKAEARKAYIATAAVIFAGDFALVHSESAPKHYRVEIKDGYANGCECGDCKYRGCYCKHQEIVDARIAKAKAAKEAEAAKATEETKPVEAPKAAKPAKPAKKIRRSAVREEVVAEYSARVSRKVGIAQVRTALAGKKTDDTQCRDAATLNLALAA